MPGLIDVRGTPDMCVRLLGVVVLLATTACSGGSSSDTLPTLPTGLPSGLQAGAYVLEIAGTDVASANVQLPGCTPPGQPANGKRVTTAGTVARDGEDWVFTSARPDSSVVLRLRVATRSFSTELFAVEGSLRGSAPDEATSQRPASGVTVDVVGEAPGQPAPVDGEIRLTGAFVTARAAGHVAFSDAAGARATCNAVSLSLQPGRLG